MGKVEAGIAAVVGLHVLHHHIREIEVSVMALGHPLILRDGFHGWKEAEVHWEVSSNGNSNNYHEVSGEGPPTEGGPVGPGVPHYLVYFTLNSEVGLFPFYR